MVQGLAHPQLSRCVIILCTRPELKSNGYIVSQHPYNKHSAVFTHAAPRCCSYSPAVTCAHHESPIGSIWSDINELVSALQGGKGGGVTKLDQKIMARRVNWLTSIRDWQQEFVGSLSAREFVDCITGDLLGQGVFVFTPSGAVMRLPKVCATSLRQAAKHWNNGRHKTVCLQYFALLRYISEWRRIKTRPATCIWLAI